MSERKQLPQSVRFNVFRRDNFTCRYCGRSSPSVVLHVDHVRAVANGGGDEIGNLVTACADCNHGKSSSSGVDAPDPAVASGKGSDGCSLAGILGFTWEDGCIEWQFEVLRAVSDNQYLVQLYSWLDGGAGECKLISHADLLSDKCTLYADADSWRSAYDKYDLRQRLRDRSKAASQ